MGKIGKADAAELYMGLLSCMCGVLRREEISDNALKAKTKSASYKLTDDLGRKWRGKIRVMKETLTELETVHEKMKAFVQDVSEGCETEKKAAEVWMESFLNEASERLREWEEEHSAVDPELAPGAETGEESAEELKSKLYRNIVNVRGLFRYLCITRSKRGENKGGNWSADPIENTLTIVEGKEKIIVKDYIDKKGRDIAQVGIDHHKLLLAAFMAIAEKSHLDMKDRTVSLKLRDFYEDTDSTNITMLRKAVENALDTLMHESWIFEVYTPGRGQENVRYNPIVSKGAVTKDSKIITIKFGEDIWKDICEQKRSYIMAVPVEILEIKTGRHPHSFFLYLKLAESKNNNRIQKPAWEGKISMKTAIKNCPLLPKESEVRNSNRDYKGRIIKPILADALALKKNTIGSVKFELYNREFNKATGKEETVFKPISYKKALELDYETARDRLVIFADKWIGYPAAQVDRAQTRHAERLEEATRKREVKDAEKIIKAEQIREKKAKEAELKEDAAN